VINHSKQNFDPIKLPSEITKVTCDLSKQSEGKIGLIWEGGLRGGAIEVTE